jgi:ketosteroid isomerase-like protein
LIAKGGERMERMKGLVAAVALLVTLAMGPVLAASASAQAAVTPEDVVAGFFDAVNSGDYEAARSLVDPNAVFLFDEGTRDEQQFTRDEFLDSLLEDENQFTVISMDSVEPGTIHVVLDITGTGIYPFSADVTVTVREGLIVRMEGILSEPLSDNAGVAPQPGMPTTGSPDDFLPVAGMLLGLLSLLGGIFVRRSLSST